MATSFALPAGYPAASGAEPDIVVRLGNCPDDPAPADYLGPNWRLAGRRFYLDIPGIVRLMAHDGREIVVEPKGAATEADIAPFILSTGFAAILHQRRLLALHAATVAWQGRAIALCGPTGAGKSTLAAALCQVGTGFVGDDIAAIRLESHEPMVWPDGRQHRLWADAIDHLALTQQQGAPVRSHMRKFHVTPRLAQNQPGTLPLAAVVLLRMQENPMPPAPPRIERLNLADAAPLLLKQVYRVTLAKKMGHEPILFGQIAALLAQVPAFLLERSPGLNHLEASAALVLAAAEQAA